MTEIVKAERAILTLGDIKLDVFQMSNGEYKYSKTDIEASLGYEPTRRAYRNFLKSKDVKALKAKELSTGNIKLKYINKNYTLVTQTEVILFWGFQAQNGNSRALSLLTACAEEALERRADIAFGVKRTEEERNILLATRIDGILSRKYWTKTVKWYLDNHEVTENYRKWVYTNISDCVNLVLFGMKAKKIMEYFGCKKSDQIRDYLPAETLKVLDCIEKGAGQRVLNANVEPKKAIKDVLEIFGISPDPSRLDN